jgi:hypothetical protein
MSFDTHFHFFKCHLTLWIWSWTSNKVCQTYTMHVIISSIIKAMLSNDRKGPLNSIIFDQGFPKKHVWISLGDGVSTANHDHKRSLCYLTILGHVCKMASSSKLDIVDSGTQCICLGLYWFWNPHVVSPTINVHILWHHSHKC